MSRSSPPSSESRIGGRYLLSGELGAGGMGVVRRARDERLARDVAVKLLPAEAVGDDHARRRLMREARAAAGLEHPGIVHVYDVGETEDGGAYLVMELVKGKSLRDHCENGTLAPRKRVAALVEVGRALAFAHEHGFVHRDIKPDNVMIRDDGRAVVLDFGLAKSASPEEDSTVTATVTAQGSFVGTPAYMAPEQARGGEIDAAVDQFALAVTVFEALTGSLPWEGSTSLEVVSEILQGVPRSMRDLCPELPLGLDDAVARALEKDPKDRFPSVNAFADAIEAASRELDASVPSAKQHAGLADTVAAPTPTPASVPRAASVSGSSVPSRVDPRRGWPAPSTVAFLLVFGLAIATAMFVAFQKPPPPPPLPASPLAMPDSVLACPMFEAKAPDFPKSGWLGAAAAHVACERAQIAFGTSMRTLVPAELANLRRVPVEGFPFEPFDEDNARDIELKAAQLTADAWLDGSIEEKPSGFKVRITLKAKDGKTLGTGEAEAMMVHEAVRDAMTTLAPSMIPPASGKEWRDPWVGGASVEATLAMHDLHIAVLAENIVVIRRDCAALVKRSDLGTMKTFVETLCAERLGEPLPPKPAIDRSSPNALITTAATFRLHELRTPEDRAVLADLGKELDDLAMNRSGDVRALVAAAAAEVFYALANRDQAERMALLSINASPKLVDIRGNAWHRLSFTTENGAGNIAAHAAWLPWEPFGQGRTFTAIVTEDGAHRGAALAMRGYWVTNYGELLIVDGNVSTASVIAAEGDSPYLTVEVLRAQGHLAKAFNLGLEMLASAPRDHRDVGSPTAALARSVVELALVLDKPVGFVDPFLRDFVDSNPPLLSKGALGFFSVIAMCLHAPHDVSKRCIDRMHELYLAGHWGAALPGAMQVLDGAMHYVAGDMPASAKIWRPLASRHAVINDTLNDVLVRAFEAGGEPGLAEKVDRDEAASTNHRLSLATARQAVREEKKGNCAKAREYAKRIVDAWDEADERPPVVGEMKKLLGRCHG